MVITDLEKKLLTDIYENEFVSPKTISYTNYNLTEEDPFEKKQEFVFHLNKLKNLGFIKFDETEAFQNAGIRSTKYKSCVQMVWSDKLHTTTDGRNLVESLK